MSKQPRRIPKYRHYKPKDLGVVRINGKDQYLGKYDSTESWEKYHRLIAEWLSHGQEPTTQKSTSTDSYPTVSVNQMLLAYWKFAETYYIKDGKPTKELSCMKEALRPVRQLYGRIAAKDFGPKALKVVRQHMMDMGLSRGVINHRVSRIKRVFITSNATEDRLRDTVMCRASLGF